MARIIIDLDETAYNLHNEWCKAHNIDYPDQPLLPENIKSWAIENYAANGLEIFKYLEDEKLFSEGKPIPGAIEYTQQWVKQGHELGIATRAITVGAVIGKTKWVKKHLPHISAVFMLLSDTKWWIDGDIFIDDAPHHLENVRGVRIMYNQPHNATETRFPRANSWSQVNGMVQFAAAAIKQGYEVAYIENLLKFIQNNKLLAGEEIWT